MDHLTTEQSNPESSNIDTLSAIDIMRLINDEDQKVACAVQRELHSIAMAAEVIADRLAKNGRLVYLGAGTSGRLGVLDASECPPTFNAHPDQVVGLIAGGSMALTTSVEGAEDNESAAIADLKQRGLSERDVLVGIASSGRTPYVISGLQYAQSLGAFTIGLTCNQASELQPYTDLLIAPIVGPEVISGSTRLKAGTATKMVLNMLTTASMVLLGKTYGHWMVDLHATNTKLKARSIRMVATITGLSSEQSEAQLVKCHGEVKTAIVASRRSVQPECARELLRKAKGNLRRVLEISSMDDDHR